VKGPLEGIRVLDLTRVLAGPFATQLLADMGADVIKVEQPGEGDVTRQMPPIRDGESHYFLSINRNKRGIAVDLKHPAGRDVVLDLARRCDVWMDNFRPGVVERLGLDYAAVSGVRPDIVYCSISAFGQTGPYRHRSAFDVAMQAIGGGMGLTGEPGGRPMRMGLPMADLATGLFAALGALAAVIERQRTGRGQLVDVAMLDAMVGLLTQFAGRYFMTGEDTEPVGSGHPSVVPYGAYETADGYVVIANLGEGFWPKIARAIGRADLIDDPRFRTNQLRMEHKAELEELVIAETRKRTTAEWEVIFEREDVPHGPVNRVSQVLAHPSVIARGMVTEFEHPRLGRWPATGRAIRFGAHEGERFEAPPLLGEDTEAVLRDVLGYDQERIAELVRTGAVALGG
jgi:crotonobetainyl-CoA:carnitine CoA-transferase CaiB-like acyl-CoA transferase